MNIKTINIPVSFQGTVAVTLSADLDDGQALALARNLALSRVMATTENPDAPDEEAFDDFLAETGIPNGAAERFWDEATVSVAYGIWTDDTAPHDQDQS